MELRILFADGKAPGGLIPQMRALYLLENKTICSIYFYRPLYPVFMEINAQSVCDLIFVTVSF